MANGKFYVVGMDAIFKSMDQLVPAVQKKVFRKVLRAGAKIVAKEAKAQAPRGKTGVLVKSIKVLARKRNRKGIIGANVTCGDEHPYKGKAYYGAFIEFGTKKLEPRPFMKEAFDAKKEEAIAEMTRLAAELIEEQIQIVAATETQYAKKR